LRFVEDDNVLMWGFIRSATQALLKEVINVLNAGAYIRTDPFQIPRHPIATPAIILISRQGLPKHYYQRRISR
jgi:hypothetical protein